MMHMTRPLHCRLLLGHTGQDESIRLRTQRRRCCLTDGHRPSRLLEHVCRYALILGLSGSARLVLALVGSRNRNSCPADLAGRWSVRVVGSSGQHCLPPCCSRSCAAGVADRVGQTSCGTDNGQVARRRSQEAAISNGLAEDKAAISLQRSARAPHPRTSERQLHTLIRAGVMPSTAESVSSSKLSAAACR